MPLTIPLNFRASDKTETHRDGVDSNPVRISMPIGLGGGGFAGSRSATPLRAKTLRAIAAALSVVDAGKTLEIVKETRENPENVIGATLDENALDQLKVLAAAISSASRNRGEDVDDISAAIRSASASVRADPYLTAVAVRTLVAGKANGYDSAMFAAALNWVAAIDYRLLETAPRVGAKERMLNYVPASVESTAALEDRIEQLEAAVAQLQEKPTKAAAGGSTK